MIMQWKEKVFDPYRRVTSNHNDEIQETLFPGDHTKLKKPGIKTKRIETVQVDTTRSPQALKVT